MIECPICYNIITDKKENNKYFCQHFFCNVCEKELEKRLMNCPMCRTKRYNLSLMNDISNASTIIVFTEYYLTDEEAEADEPEADFVVRISTQHSNNI